MSTILTNGARQKVSTYMKKNRDEIGRRTT